MNDASTVLLAQDVHKSYQQGPTKLKILQGLHLSVAAGQRVAVVGRSGAGKSTLLHLLAGLDDVDSGSIEIVGESLSAARPGQRAAIRNRHMGFVYQAHHLLPEFSALENVAMPLRLRGEGASHAREQASDMLAQVGLAERLHHRPAALSGGERQRVAVARALVAQPSVVLADEPTGNLDSENAEAVFELICRLSDEKRVAFVIVTHDRSMASRLDQAFELSGGVLMPLSL